MCFGVDLRRDFAGAEQADGNRVLCAANLEPRTIPRPLPGVDTISQMVICSPVLLANQICNPSRQQRACLAVVCGEPALHSLMAPSMTGGLHLRCQEGVEE